MTSLAEQLLKAGFPSSGLRAKQIRDILHESDWYDITDLAGKGKDIVLCAQWQSFSDVEKKWFLALCNRLKGESFKSSCKYTSCACDFTGHTAAVAQLPVGNVRGSLLAVGAHASHGASECSSVCECRHVTLL